MDSGCDAAELTALLGDWAAGPGALHRRLAAGLRRCIADGSLSPGRRLPSERALAAALAVSRTTVVGAYDALRAEGALTSRRGSGTRVDGAAPARIPAWAPGARKQFLYGTIVDGPGETIPLTSVLVEALPAVAEAITETTREDLPGLLAESSYHPRGLPELRQALAERYSRKGLATHADQIVVTTGSQQALSLVTQLYLGRGTAAVVESPGYAGCLDVMRVAGAELHQAPLDEHGVDMRAVRRLVREHAPRLIYVMPSYHNPTGLMMSAARRRELAGFAAAAGVTILEDCAYTGIRSPREPPPLAASAPGDAEVLTVESLNKIAWSGLRLGWLRAPAEIAARIGRRKVLHDLASPLLEQAVTLRLLAREDELDRARAAQLHERMAFVERRLSDRLPEWRWRRPDGGAALWITLPHGASARELSQIALRHGVEVDPGFPDPDHGGLDACFRLPFNLAEPVMDQALGRLARAWEELRRHGPERAPERVVV